jgi:hypothetical protein
MDEQKDELTLQARNAPHFLLRWVFSILRSNTLFVNEQRAYVCQSYYYVAIIGLIIEAARE